MPIRPIVVLLCLLLFSTSSCNTDERDAWNDAFEKHTTEAIDSFLLKYPEGAYKAQAATAQEDLYWEKARETPTVWNYLMYADRYPEGRYLQEVLNGVGKLPVEAINTHSMRARPFSGTLETAGGIQLALLDFQDFKDTGDSLRFVAHLNSGPLKETVMGNISKKDNSIFINKVVGQPVFLIHTPGRIYLKNGKLFIESTDLKQYWKISQ